MAHSIRPTLPPLHTLGLPRGDPPPRTHELHDPNRPRPPKFALVLPYLQQRHQPPTSPSTPSETPTAPVLCLLLGPNTLASILASASASTPTAPVYFPKIYLSPTSFENANAVILVPPPPPPGVPRAQILFFVDPALRELRLRRYLIEPGTRVLSYRILPPRDLSDPRPPTGPSDTRA